MHRLEVRDLQKRKALQHPRKKGPLSYRLSKMILYDKTETHAKFNMPP